MTQTTENSTKLNSRKFAVWLIWLLITLAVGVYTFIAHEDALLAHTLDNFFTLSMMYLGMNVAQKAGFALADALHKNTPEEEEDE